MTSLLFLRTTPNFIEPVSGPIPSGIDNYPHCTIVQFLNQPSKEVENSSVSMQGCMTVFEFTFILIWHKISSVQLLLLFVLILL